MGWSSSIIKGGDVMKKFIILIVMKLILYFPILGFAENVFFVQVGSFKSFKNADITLQKLRENGFNCEKREKENCYKVFCGGEKDFDKMVRLKKQLNEKGYMDAFLVTENKKQENNNKDSKEINNINKEIKKERITADIFGRRRGYIHPFLSITGYWTDNIFNTNKNKKSDYVAIITPGIRLTIPKVKELKLADIETSTVTPGGIKVSRFVRKFPRRYQLYLMYRTDIEQFKRYSSENFVNHRLEGIFQYNMRGGVSVNLTEQFIKSHDLRGTGVSTELDKFYTNLIGIMFTYDPGWRLMFRLEYNNYLVNYTEKRNDFRDRTDNSVAGYVFYKFLPKTASFFEYEFVDINYRKSKISDSKEHHFFGGIQWDITAKSRGRVKVGYGIKDFNNSNDSNKKDVIVEAQLAHAFTPKTSLNFIATRKTQETNILGTDYILSNSFKINYYQKITFKISGQLGISYEFDKYKGNINYAGETKERKDDIYRSSIGLVYKFKEWLRTETGYSYTKRDSNFSDFDYTNNTIFFRIIGSL